MYKEIPLSIPFIGGNEWEYTKQCLDSGWVSSAGKYVERFESKLQAYTGSKHAIACVNGTSAIHVSLILGGVKPNDEVIVPTLTFIAPINAVTYCGAHPVFMDADRYYNLDAAKTMDFILKETTFKKGFSYNRKTRRRVVAIMPVHVFGNAVWMDGLFELCAERNIKIIEDATEALGTRYTTGQFKGKHVGTVGDLGCLSFNGNKIITTGGGGMILTNNKAFASKARYLTTQAKDDSLRFIHNSVGYNYRLTNVQAAIGLAQLEQLPTFLNMKKRNYDLYRKNLKDVNGLHFMETPDYADSNHWMYALRVGSSYGMSLWALIKYLLDKRIEARPVWKLNHLQVPFKTFQTHRIEQAVELVKSTINVPCSTSLTEQEVRYVCKKLKKRN